MSRPAELTMAQTHFAGRVGGRQHPSLTAKLQYTSTFTIRIKLDTDRCSFGCSPLKTTLRHDRWHITVNGERLLPSPKSEPSEHKAAVSAAHTPAATVMELFTQRSLLVVPEATVVGIHCNGGAITACMRVYGQDCNLQLSHAARLEFHSCHIIDASAPAVSVEHACTCGTCSNGLVTRGASAPTDEDTKHAEDAWESIGCRGDAETSVVVVRDSVVSLPASWAAFEGAVRSSGWAQRERSELAVQVSHHEDGSWSATVPSGSLSLHGDSVAASWGVHKACMSGTCAPVELHNSFVWGKPALSPTTSTPDPEQRELRTSEFEFAAGQCTRLWEGNLAAVEAFAMHAGHANASQVLKLRIWRIGGSWLKRSLEHWGVRGAAAVCKALAYALCGRTQQLLDAAAHTRKAALQVLHTRSTPRVTSRGPWARRARTAVSGSNATPSSRGGSHPAPASSEACTSSDPPHSRARSQPTGSGPGDRSEDGTGSGRASGGGSGTGTSAAAGQPPAASNEPHSGQHNSIATPCRAWDGELGGAPSRSVLSSPQRRLLMQLLSTLEDASLVKTLQDQFLFSQHAVTEPAGCIEQISAAAAPPPGSGHPDHEITENIRQKQQTCSKRASGNATPDAPSATEYQLASNSAAVPHETGAAASEPGAAQAAACGPRMGAAVASQQILARKGVTATIRSSSEAAHPEKQLPAHNRRGHRTPRHLERGEQCLDSAPSTHQAAQAALWHSDTAALTHREASAQPTGVRELHACELSALDANSLHALQMQGMHNSRSAKQGQHAQQASQALHMWLKDSSRAAVQCGKQRQRTQRARRSMGRSSHAPRASSTASASVQPHSGPLPHSSTPKDGSFATAPAATASVSQSASPPSPTALGTNAGEDSPTEETSSAPKTRNARAKEQQQATVAAATQRKDVGSSGGSDEAGGGESLEPTSGAGHETDSTERRRAEAAFAALDDVARSTTASATSEPTGVPPAPPHQQLASEAPAAGQVGGCRNLIENALAEAALHDSPIYRQMLTDGRGNADAGEWGLPQGMHAAHAYTSSQQLATAEHSAPVPGPGMAENTDASLLQECMKVMQQSRPEEVTGHGPPPHVKVAQMVAERSEGGGEGAADSGSGAGSGQSDGDVHQTIQDAVTRMRRALRRGAEQQLQQELQIWSVLGQGRFGTVYYGRWRSLPVAIKTVIFQSTQQQLAQVSREVAIASSLTHEHIVITFSHDLDRVEGDRTAATGACDGELRVFKLHLIQEYANGRSLREALAGGMLKRCRARWRSLITILTHIACGMRHVHANRICHGDLNPSNILLQYDDTVLENLEQALAEGAVDAKIADFGMAMRLSNEASHASSVHCGTAFYMAPEIESERKFHPASDVYSFGVMMWELMMSCLVYYPCKVKRRRQRSRSTAGRSQGARTHTTTSSSASGRGSQASKAHSYPPAQPSTPSQSSDTVLALHPHFLRLPATAPLTYHLLMQVCLSTRPADRLSFRQVVQLLLCVTREVATGSYVDVLGRTQDSSLLDVMRLPSAPNATKKHKSRPASHLNSPTRA